ncbi:MAG: cobyric acid synthase [Pseudomonadota bacterium]
MSGARRRPSIMIQGAGSNVGKSMLTAGLCRHFTRLGLRVRPFKPQNMSNNAAVTADGGEIGRAQALQARACGVAPLVDMNPVLLKPESERGAQLVVQGQCRETLRAAAYAHVKPTLLAPVLDSYRRLQAEADLMIIEGAGSPAEVNLRAGDIANMGFARAADAPVLLVGDIDRGGVIAQMVGTRAVLDPEDAAQIQGFMINKFRGDPKLFDDGYAAIAEATGWRGCGVLPWFDGAARLPAEDVLDLHRPAASAAEDGAQSRRILVACLALSRIANFDDLDPLRMEPGVELRIIPRGEALPGDADLVILPGSKTTRADLAMLREEGWDIDLLAHRRRGGRVLGICGGYQMLGRAIRDPDGLDGPPGETPGLGLLDVETVMAPDKRLAEVTGRHIASGAPLRGYEIHMGRTDGPDRARPMAEIEGPAAAGRKPRTDGARSADGRVEGVYLHGLFSADAFRAAYLTELGAKGAGLDFEAQVDATLDALADHMAAHADLDAIAAIAGVA